MGWAWDGGTSTVSNTDGSITSSVRASASKGFSICTWSGTGSAGTIGHSLNASLQMIWIKQRTNHGTTGQGDGNWIVGHEGLGMGSGRLILNDTYPTDAGSGAAAHWNSTAATSTVFSVGTSGNVNGSNGAEYVAYCWSEILGFSKYGKYTGNGSSDGPFVYTGFRPKWLMIKVVNIGGESWVIKDSERGSFNPNDPNLFANLINAEQISNSPRYIDFLSNGFKLRGSETSVNSSNNTFIYACFAEHPLKTARAR